MDAVITFKPVELDNWGFQPVQPITEVWCGNAPDPAGLIFRTYRNHPHLIPGKEIWAYRLKRTMAWLLESEISEADLQEQIRNYYSHLKEQKS